VRPRPSAAGQDPREAAAEKKVRRRFNIQVWIQTLKPIGMISGSFEDTAPSPGLIPLSILWLCPPVEQITYAEARRRSAEAEAAAPKGERLGLF
jgi:hypothetical protein